MDRYYTMRPINLAGEVSGFRAELVGVGAGADALRTIMQNAIQRVGVSITPIVCQQLFIEVMNAAVDFACDSGTSVNLADIISFKWNTRGKYDRIDASVPKSALSLTAIVSPKITRNATPHFDLKLQPSEPTLLKVNDPFDTYTRGVIARGLSLGNLNTLRIVDAITRDVIATYERSIHFYVSDNAREIICAADPVLLRNIPEGQRAMLEYSTYDAPSVFHSWSIDFTMLKRDVADVIITGATPQPLNIDSQVGGEIWGEGLTNVASIRFDDAAGATKFTVVPELAASGLQFGPEHITKVSALPNSAVLYAHFLRADSSEAAVFNIFVEAYTM